MRMFFGEDATVIIRCAKSEDKEVEKQELADFLTGMGVAEKIPTLEKAIVLACLTQTTVIKVNVAKETIRMIPGDERIQVSPELIKYLIDM